MKIETEIEEAECIECGEGYSARRRELGYRTCLDCGETIALHKANEGVRERNKMIEQYADFIRYSSK